MASPASESIQKYTLPAPGPVHPIRCTETLEQKPRRQASHTVNLHNGKAANICLRGCAPSNPGNIKIGWGPHTQARLRRPPQKQFTNIPAQTTTLGRTVPKSVFIAGNAPHALARSLRHDAPNAIGIERGTHLMIDPALKTLRYFVRGCMRACVKRDLEKFKGFRLANYEVKVFRLANCKVKGFRMVSGEV